MFQQKSSLLVLSGFIPNTEYEIMMVAVNEIGLGPSSCAMQYVTTMEDSKSYITNVLSLSPSLSLNFSLENK